MFEMIFDPNSSIMWILIIAILAGAVAVISRPFSTYVKFVYPNAKFEAMGNPFIGEKELSSIIDSKDIVSFKETINTLKDYNVSGEDIYDLQKSLDDTFLDTVKMMKIDSSKKMEQFYDTYLEKLDMHLIKTAIKKKIDGLEISEGIINEAVLAETKKFLEKLIEVNKEKLTEFLKEYAFGKNLENILSEGKISHLKIDIALDKYFVGKLNSVKVPYKCSEGKTKFIKTFIDILNLKNLLRAKNLGYSQDSCKGLFIGEGREIALWKFDELSEEESVSQVITSLEGTSYYDVLKNSIETYNKTKSTQILEIALDSLFLDLVSKISTQNYVTIGPSLRFLVSKEFEIRNLKIIAKGISEKLPSDHIKDFLVTEVES